MDVDRLRDRIERFTYSGASFADWEFREFLKELMFLLENIPEPDLILPNQPVSNPGTVARQKPDELYQAWKALEKTGVRSVSGEAVLVQLLGGILGELQTIRQALGLESPDVRRSLPQTPEVETRLKVTKSLDGTTEAAFYDVDPTDPDPVQPPLPPRRIAPADPVADPQKPEDKSPGQLAARKKRGTGWRDSYSATSGEFKKTLDPGRPFDDIPPGFV